MNTKRLLKKNIILAAGSVLTTVLLGFVFNACHQAYVFNKAFKPNAQIAVFVDAERKVAPEVILEKLVNLDGVDKAELVPKEKILETAQSENSQFKSVVLDGENPFSPYYLVYPKKISLFGAGGLVETIKKIDGIKDAVFDENLFSAVKKTGQFVNFYIVSGKTTAIIVLLLIVLKFVYRQLNGDADFLNYVYNLILGAMSGLIGACVFYLITRKIAPMDIVRLPARYITYFVLSGILTALLWEND